ncbi:DEKNAAC102224 [Brettanomyces naardenensis]|uniref:DEKNAAC102224 n=1 Tax=Brettanomyces naardenensis TaxID=13370 RepID=A0A448YKK8_BRENA|nr:DEKNAAC102224 [Brettanomyces naardenensis]
MFRSGLRSVISGARRAPTADSKLFARFQSNSSSSSQSASASSLAKKKLTLLEQQQQQQQQQKSKVDEDVEEQQVEDGSVSNGKKLSKQGDLDNRLQSKETRIRRGFSSVNKVPSTASIRAKDILLDSLLQGYRPLTLPLVPPQAPKRSPTVVYFEFDDNMDVLENGLNELTGNNAGGIQTSVDILKDKNLTRYQYSNYSFSADGDPLYKEGDLEDHLHKEQNSKLTKAFNESYKLSNRKVGRRRMQYVHNSKRHKGRK